MTISMYQKMRVGVVHFKAFPGPGERRRPARGYA